MSKYYDKLIQINEALDKEMLDKGVANAEIQANDTIVPNDKTTPIVEDGGTDENSIEIPKDSLTPDQKKEILLDKGVDQKAVDNLKDDKELDGALDATLNNDEVKTESLGTDTSLMDWEGPAIIVHQVPSGSGNEYYVKDGEWSTDVKYAFEFESKEAAKEKIDELCERGISEDSMFIWSAKSKLDESDGAVKVEDDIDESVIIRMDDDDLDMHGYLKSDDGLNKGELEWTDDIKAAKVFQHEELGQNKIEAICAKFHYDPSTFKTISLDPRADEPYEDDEEGQNWISLDPMHPGATTLP